MVQPSNPKWGDFLQERIQKEGSKAKAEKALDALDTIKAKTVDIMKLEVAAAGGDAAMLVAMKEDEVRFVHNITLTKTQEDFVLVGVTPTETTDESPHKIIEPSTNIATSATLDF